MTTYTITTGTPAARVDWATVGARTTADLLTINGGHIMVDVDSRYGVGATKNGSFGNIAMSATLGGSIEFNATGVRMIPFAAGSGVVPAADALISRGAAEGKLIAVFASLTTAPLVTGAAMPANGFVKIRQWNQVPFTAGSLSGIAATGGVDFAGMLEILMLDLGTVTVNRLNKLAMKGDWYTFQDQLTSGDNSQSFQIPCQAGVDAVYFPGVEVETAVGSGVYESYPCAGSIAAIPANIATDKLRGRWCWVEASTGKIRFQNDGANSGGGYLPPAGLRVRAPSLWFSSTTTNSGVHKVPHATIASRYKFNTAGGGDVTIDKCALAMYLVFSQPYDVVMNDTHVFEAVSLSECASAVDWTNVNVGQSAAVSSFAFYGSLLFSGGTMNRCTWTRATLGGATQVVAMLDCDGFDFIDERTHGVTKGSNTSAGSRSFTRVNNSKWIDCLSGAGQNAYATCQGITIIRPVYYDHPATTTSALLTAYYAFVVSAVCVDVMIDGMSFGGLSMVQPLGGILSIGAAGCKNITLRNLGTDAVPLDLGGPRRDFVAWTRAAAVITVNAVGHGLKVGDYIFVPVSSNAVAITLAAKVVTAAATPDTFTFAGVNSGTTAGTFSYFPVVSQYLFAISSSAAANNVRVQRCNVPHTRVNLYILDNSSKNTTIDNVTGDYLNPFLTPGLNMKLRAVSGTPSLAAQTGVYGTHWFDVFNADVTIGLTGLAWTRVGTVATVTAPDHKLRTGLLVNVNVCSDIAGVSLGTRAVTVLDADTFTIAVTASGPVSGTLGMRTVIDRLVLMMNEPTEETADQVSDILGGSAFTAAGGVFAGNPGDSITFTQPEFTLSVTGFPIAEVTLLGSTQSHYLLEYQLDTGGGFGAWRNLSRACVGGSGTTGNFTFDVTDATGVEIGDYVFGTGIGGNAKVVSISGNTVTVDERNDSTVSGYIRFNHLRNSVVGTGGARLRVRITNKIAIATPITSLSIYADTDDASRSRKYPLDLTTVSLLDTVPGSRIQIYNVTKASEVSNTTVNGTSWNLSYVPGDSIDPGDVIRIRLTNASAAAAYREFQTFAIAAAGNWSVLAAQLPDPFYATIGVDGHGVAEFTADYAGSKVDINKPDGITSADRLYAWWTANLTTAEGIRNWFGGLTAEDDANFRVNTAALNLKLNNARSNGVQFLGDMRLFRDDGGMPVVSSTTGGGSIVLYAGKVYAVAMAGGGGGGALSPVQAAQLEDLASRVPGLALETTAQDILSTTGLIPALL